MAWYQRNYFKYFFRFLCIFIFLVCSFYFLDFFGQNKALCFNPNSVRCPELRRLSVGGITVLYSHTLHQQEVKLMIELFQENLRQALLNNTINHNSFSISKFMKTDGTFFPRSSPFSHWNISLDLYTNWQWNTGAYHQLTTHKNVLIKPINGFDFFKGTDLCLTVDSQQLISNELRFYDYDFLKPIKDDDDDMIEQFEEFKLKNQIKLSEHFGKSLGFDI